MTQKRFFNTEMKWGVSLFCTMVAISFLGPFFIPSQHILSQYMLPMDLSKAFEAPSLQHPFGLDENGVDLGIQMLLGARISLTVALSVVCINLLIGVIIGGIAAWYEGIVDQILMRCVDLVFAFPKFLLALAVLAMWGAGLYHLIFALCVTGWAGFARVLRAEVLYLKKQDYVLAAFSYGASSIRLLVKHITPNVLGVILVQVMFSLSAVVIAEAGLSFLGLGLPQNIPSWGRLMSQGRTTLITAPHIALFPGLALFTLTLSFQLFAEALRKYFLPVNKVVS